MQENNTVNSKVISAVKWSAAGEILAKIITPVTTMILARLLAPDAFGVVATIMLIVGFANIFTDVGFSRYIVQHEFDDTRDLYRFSNTAFIANLTFSLLILGVIAIFSESLAALVGNPGMGNILIVSSIAIPLTAFSSIQRAIYTRNFGFKMLFAVRVMEVSVPLVVTTTLAFIGLGFWALIIGTLLREILAACVLTACSKWKPRFYFRIGELNRMLSFGIWSQLETLCWWLTNSVDIFLISSAFSLFYVGEYKTSVTLVVAIFSMFAASVSRPLFSGMSRFQNDLSELRHLYFNTQKMVALLALPLGVGLFVFQDMAAYIMLGKDWPDAGTIIGIMSLAEAVAVVFYELSRPALLAKGKIRTIFALLVVHLFLLILTCVISRQYGFLEFVYARAAIKLTLPILFLIAMHFIMKMRITQKFYNIWPILIAAPVMGFAGYFLRNLKNGIAWDGICIIICIAVYFGALSMFPNMRKYLISIVRKSLRKQ
jgi:PST family polysaccharide transporter